MTAPLQAPSKISVGSQHRPQDDVIREDKIAGLALPVPVWPELKMPLDLYDKKPRFSLMTLIGPVCLAAAAFVPYM